MDDFRTYRVADAMTYRPRCVSPQASLAEARELFVTPGTDCVPVTEDGMLVGVLTSFDLLKAFASPPQESPPPYADVMGAPVRRVMSETPVSVPPDMPLVRAFQLLVTTRYRSLPVAIGALLIGMISRADVLRALERAGEARRQDRAFA